MWAWFPANGKINLKLREGWRPKEALRELDLRDVAESAFTKLTKGEQHATKA
jgi:hypothetical protein